MKTPGLPTYTVLHAALAPLREEGYLTTYTPSTSTLHHGPVTVIGTGNTPLPPILNAEKRDIFYDAPLTTLHTNPGFAPELSPIASTSFRADFGDVKVPLGETQKALLRERVRVAHEMGLLVRYWDLPAWPLGLRGEVWSALWEAGVDLLNVDDLEAGAGWCGGIGDGMRGDGGQGMKIGGRDEL